MANQPTSPGEQPPPDVPGGPTISDALGNYLRQFSLWARRGFRAKLDGGVALPGIMLTVYDATTGQPTNATCMLTIKSGTPMTIVLTQVAAGLGQP